MRSGKPLNRSVRTGYCKSRSLNLFLCYLVDLNYTDLITIVGKYAGIDLNGFSGKEPYSFLEQVGIYLLGVLILSVLCAFNASGYSQFSVIALTYIDDDLIRCLAVLYIRISAILLIEQIFMAADILVAELLQE